MFQKNQALRQLVLNRDSNGLPNEYRLYCYIIHPSGQWSRSSGVTGLITGGRRSIFAEFAYPPFGYILTFADSAPPDADLMDISFFAQHSFNEYRELHLRLPVRHIASYYPADFRTRDEWLKALN